MLNRRVLALNYSICDTEFTSQKQFTTNLNKNDGNSPFTYCTNYTDNKATHHCWIYFWFLYS